MSPLNFGCLDWTPPENNTSSDPHPDRLFSQFLTCHLEVYAALISLLTFCSGILPGILFGIKSGILSGTRGAHPSTIKYHTGNLSSLSENRLPRATIVKFLKR